MIRQKIEYLLKHNFLAQKCYKVGVSFCLNVVGRFLKVEPNLVLINSFGGKSFGDSSKTVYDYLRTHDEYKDLDIVWAFQEPERFDTGCRKVKMDSWNYLKTALKAKYWITCVNIERGLNIKKKTTKYLNTWHGIPFKYIGNDVVGRNDYDLSAIDVFCYSGEYEREIYKRAFKLRDSSMIKCGIPRNDELYNVSEEKIISLKKELDLPLNKKIILYAPTWRESTDNGKNYIIAPPMNLDMWKKELGDTHILLFRAHHLTTKQMGVRFNDFVRDMSNLPSINELMMVSDVLISDYSATIFDYSILERPIISFAYDYEEYIAKRGLYIDMREELPDGICKTECEVLEKLLNMDYKDQSERTKRFKEKYIEVGGNATEVCVKRLFGK